MTKRTPKPRAGGPSWPQSRRVAAGMPVRQFVLPVAVDALVNRLAEVTGKSRSQVVAAAIESYAEDLGVRES